MIPQITGPWRTSTHSQTSNCVEVAEMNTGMAVRDSKDRTGPTLTFGPDAWKNFVNNVPTNA